MFCRGALSGCAGVTFWFLVLLFFSSSSVREAEQACCFIEALSDLVRV